MADVCLSLGIMFNCICFTHEDLNYYTLYTDACTKKQNEMILERLANKFAPNATEDNCIILMEDSNMTTLPTLPRTLPIMVINMDSNHLQELTQPTHEFLKLQSLHMQDNQINSIDRSFLCAFPNIATLNLSNNSLRHLGKMTICTDNKHIMLNNLKSMNLDNNQISFVENGFFSTSPNIEKLSMAGNHLTILNNSIFLSSSNKTTTYAAMSDLSFKHNRIFHIDAEFLSVFPYLETLNLKHNLIRRLDSKLCYHNNQTITLSLLHSLYVSWNLISYISPGFFSSFPSLRELYMSHNYIQYIRADMFSTFGEIISYNVDVVNLTHNKIAHIDDEVFTSILPNLTELNLSYNRLSHLAIKINTGSLVYLQNNNLRTIDIATSLKLDKLELEIHPTMEHFNISNNQLRSLPELWHHIRVDTGSLYLHGNPWYCDCDLRWMKYWVRENSDSNEIKSVVCDGPIYNRGSMLTTLADFRYICYSEIFAPTVSVLSIAILVFLTYKWRYRWKFWLYNKYGFHPFDKDECENEDKRFDVFLSYSNEESEFAQKLMDDLGRAGFCVCCHELDFRVGTCIGENVERAVHYSKRTLCIVSRAFMQSRCCMQEFVTARSFDFTHRRNRLIMVLYEEVPQEELHEEIRLYISSFTYLRRDAAFFMARLMYVLPQVRIGDLDDEHRPLLSDPRQDGYGANRQVQVV